MIAIYIRTSTTEQNLDTQRHVLKEWLKSKPHQEYVDDGYSGDNIRRPGFRQLQADIKAGKVTTLVVFRLDRLSRRTATGVSLMHRWLDQGLRVVSVMESIDIDPDDPQMSGLIVDIMIPMLFAFAQNEQRVRRTRQAEGIKAAKRDGKYHGRKKGAEGVEDKKRASKARHLRSEKWKLREIAAELGVSKATVCRYLKAG